MLRIPVPSTILGAVDPPTILAAVVPPTILGAVDPPTILGAVVPQTILGAVDPPTILRAVVPPISPRCCSPSNYPRSCSPSNHPRSCSPSHQKGSHYQLPHFVPVPTAFLGVLVPAAIHGFFAPLISEDSLELPKNPRKLSHPRNVCPSTQPKSTWIS